MKALIAGWWDERNDREKRLLSIGLLVLGVFLFLRILVIPALDGSAAIRASLPALKSQVATMEAEAIEAKRLTSVANGATPTGDALLNGVKQSLTDHGLPADRVELNGGAVRIEMTKVAFSSWIRWLDDTRRQMKIKVTQSRVTPVDRDGRVNLNATLESATSAAHGSRQGGN